MALHRLIDVEIGVPDPSRIDDFYQEIGFTGGAGSWGGADHYLNHYALEHDDFDAVMRAASVYLRAHGDERQIAGPGRHQIGGNIFWYMLDPSGTFFEYFADMDRIVDDEAWEIKTDWEPADSWSVWGQGSQPEVFFAPKDMNEIVEGWSKAHE